MYPYCPQSKEDVSRVKDLLHAADLVPRVEVFQVEEVQQHLRHVFILVNYVLKQQRTTLNKCVFWAKMCDVRT